MTKLTSKPRPRAAYYLNQTRPETTGDQDEKELRRPLVLPGEPERDFDWTAWYEALADNPAWAAIQARYDQAADELHQARAEFIRESGCGFYPSSPVQTERTDSQDQPERGTAPTRPGLPAGRSSRWPNAAHLDDESAGSKQLYDAGTGRTTGSVDKGLTTRYKSSNSLSHSHDVVTNNEDGP